MHTHVHNIYVFLHQSPGNKSPMGSQGSAKDILPKLLPRRNFKPSASNEAQQNRLARRSDIEPVSHPAYIHTYFVCVCVCVCVYIHAYSANFKPSASNETQQNRLARRSDMEPVSHAAYIHTCCRADLQHCLQFLHKHMFPNACSCRGAILRPRHTACLSVYTYVRGPLNSNHNFHTHTGNTMSAAAMMQSSDLDTLHVCLSIHMCADFQT